MPDDPSPNHKKELVMIRSRVACFIMVLSLLMAAPSAAQEASPPATPAGSDFSLLRDLGLPEINLVATDDEVSGVPAELAADRYLVTLESQTSDQDIQVLFLATPAGLSDQDALDGIVGEGIPPWLYDATFAGGPNAGAGQTDTVVIELAAGDWWIDIDRSADAAVQPTDTATKLQVTGEMTLTEEIADAIPVQLSEYSFIMPATLASGPQIWHLTNTGAQPHFLGLAEVPDGTTFDQVMEFIDTTFTGTPAVSALGPDDVHDVYSSAIISSGQTTWIEVNLAPGTYGLACFFSDQASGAPHALMGMVQVFTVA
jgi:hypothetical protein